MPAAERAQLEQIVANGNTPQKLARRARVLLMVANQQRPRRIAITTGISRNQVYLWMQRYVQGGVTALLSDASRPPGRRPIAPAKIAAIVEATLKTRPPAATHWSSRQMAKAQGISEAMVRKIWRQHGLQPHRVERFKFSKDRYFVDKLRESSVCI
jgi:transposase